MECEIIRNISKTLKIDDLIKDQRYPLGGGFELSCKCNLSCIHCYAKPEAMDEDLSLEQIKSIIDDLYDNDVLFLYLTGGEPMARPDFPEIYIYLKEKGFMVEILTNGTLINKDIINLFNKYPPLKVDISMYGCSEDTYGIVTGHRENYVKFQNSIKLLDENNIKYQLKTIVIKETLQDLQAMREYAHKKNIRFRYTFNVFPDLSGSHQPLAHALDPLTILNEELRDSDRMNMWRHLHKASNPYKRRIENGIYVPLYLCNCADFSFFITHKGRLQGCNKNRKHGYDLLTTKFADAWKGLEEIKKIPASSQYKCALCDHLPMCDQCTAENAAYHGEAYAEIPCEYKCEYVKIRSKYFEQEVFL